PTVSKNAATKKKAFMVDPHTRRSAGDEVRKANEVPVSSLSASERLQGDREVRGHVLHEADAAGVPTGPLPAGVLYHRLLDADGFHVLAIEAELLGAIGLQHRFLWRNPIPIPGPTRRRRRLECYCAHAYEREVMTFEERTLVLIDLPHETRV